MFTKRLKTICLTLAVNLTVCLTLLPLTLPPFRFSTLPELGEVIFWQGMGMIGWPFVIMGAVLGLVIYTSADNLAVLFIVLAYPGMLAFFVAALFGKEVRRWHLILLHLLFTLSFVAAWYRVLNGYDFMTG